MLAISIFDFDQTISKVHTFSSFCKRSLIQDDEASYQAGKLNARHNLNTGVADYLKHDGVANLSAIVTFHNNPAFIAGFISTVLNIKLTYMQTRTKNLLDKTLQIAIDFYGVIGIKAPFLIAYLPVVEEPYTLTINSMNGKNNQIKFLQEILFDEDLIDVYSRIDFYDDSPEHIDAGEELTFLRNRYLIKPNQARFTIISSELELAKTAAPPLDQPLIQPSDMFVAEPQEARVLDSAAPSQNILKRVSGAGAGRYSSFFLQRLRRDSEKSEEERGFKITPV